MNSFQILLIRYAEGKAICGCGKAYLTPCMEVYKNGKRESGHLGCEHGCSSNQIVAKEHVARCVIAEFKITE